jgi:hypothetical protein
MGRLLPAYFLTQGFYGFPQTLGAPGCQADHVLQMPRAFDFSGLFKFLGKGHILLIVIFAMMNPVLKPNSCLLNEFHKLLLLDLKSEYAIPYWRRDLKPDAGNLVSARSITRYINLLTKRISRLNIRLPFLRNTFTFS